MSTKLGTSGLKAGEHVRNKATDGGPAFPQPSYETFVSNAGISSHGHSPLYYTMQKTKFDGMSLRDYFAAQALAGILAGPCSREDVHVNEWLDVPQMAYAIADAMLRVREQETPHG